VPAAAVVVVVAAVAVAAVAVAVAMIAAVAITVLMKVMVLRNGGEAISALPGERVRKDLGRKIPRKRKVGIRRSIQ
jgi:hypothetical protein